MHRQFRRTLVAMVIIGAMLIAPAYAESAVITGSKVNLRAGPGTSYYIAATIDKGTTVDVLNRADASWYYVNYNGIEGFVSSAYLSINGSSVSGTSSSSSSASVSSGITIIETDSSGKYSAGTKGYINSNYVRFRSGPGSNYSVIGEYNTGKEIEIVTTVSGWIAGYIDGNPGYVSKEYVTVGTTPTTSAVTPTGTTSGGITVISPADIQPDYTIPMPETTQTVGNITVVSPAPTPTPTPESKAFYVTPEPTATAAVSMVTVLPNANANGAKAYIYGTYVRFRTGPGTNYSIIGTYNTGKEAVAYANAGNGWIFCRIDGQEGYIYEDYIYVVPSSASATSSSSASDSTAASSAVGNITVISAPLATAQPVATQQKTAYITGNNVRFRAAPSMTSQILGELFYGNEVTVTGYSDGWAQIYINGSVAYVYADYVREGSYGAVTNTASSGETAVNPVSYGNVTAQDVVNLAMQYLGAKYTWGGVSPDTGFDCSGFVYFVFKSLGKTLNRVASDQASNGVHIDPANIQPGDIICFYSGSSYIGHVGIYIGNNKFIHASNSTTGVIISDLSGYYSSRGYEIRRIV